MTLNLKLPSLWTTIAGAALAVLVALNDQVFHFGQPWATAINMAVIWAGVFGVSLLSADGLRSVIQLTPAESAAVAAVFTALQSFLGEASLSSGLRTALQAILVALTTLGFGQASRTVVKRARSELRARKAAAREPRVVR